MKNKKSLYLFAKRYYNAIMKLIIQRVNRAELSVNDTVVSSINQGLIVFVGFKAGDGEKQIAYAVKKIVDMRIFRDENDKMNLSVTDIKGDILLVSNFTLYADCSRGHRPNFMNALSGTEAKVLYEELVRKFSQNFSGKLQTGVFGEHMIINQESDGPINIQIDID